MSTWVEVVYKITENTDLSAINEEVACNIWYRYIYKISEKLHQVAEHKQHDIVEEH